MQTPYLISYPYNSLVKRKRDIDIGDLYQNKIYLYQFNIYGSEEDIIRYILDNIKNQNPNHYLNSAITKDNWNSYDPINIIYSKKWPPNIILSPYDIVKEVFINPDIIIIGGGTTACALVHGLQNTDKRILLLDAGKIIVDENVTNINNFFTVWKDPYYTNIFGISTDLERTNFVSHVYNCGGCSIHNGALCVIPSRSYLDQLGSNFTVEKVDQCYNDLFMKVNIRTSKPSQLGEIVSPIISEIFSVPNVDDYNLEVTSSSSSGQFFETPDGKRELLTKLLTQSKTVKVINDFYVDKILFNGKNAIGIMGGNGEMIFASQIILSAGVESSVILERSGIGKRKVLEDLLIPVVYENSHVGEHVKNQLGPSLVIRTSNTELLKPADTNSLGTVSMAFLTSDNSERKFQIFSSLHPFVEAPISKIYDFTNCFGINICDLSPESEGYFHISSRKIFTQPHIKFNYYNDKIDILNGISAYKKVYKIYQKLKELHPKDEFELVFPPESIFNDDSNDTLIEKYLDAATLLEEHYTSACRIGDVVDENFDVIGVTGLKIADASVLPKPPDGNPQATCMIIGYIVGTLLS